MRRLALALPTIAMLICLVAYGGSNAAFARRQAQMDQGLKPLKPMHLASMSAQEADALSARRQTVSSIALSKEQQIIAQLGLSVQQMTAYSQLRQTIDQQTPAEDPAQAAAIALQTSAKFRDGLKQILTAEQYRRYRELWDQPCKTEGPLKPQADVNNGEDIVGPPGGAPPSPDELLALFSTSGACACST